VCPITTLWSNVTSKLKNIYGLHVGVQPVMMTVDMCHDVVLTSPEGLLILYKSGIFAIDTSIVSFQTWPRHRDDLGVYWKRQKRTYQSPSRLVRESSVVRRHYILLLEPSDVRALCIRKTADLLPQLWVSTFPRFVAIGFYFLSETFI
jgi:hypothetical protein